MQIAYFSSLFNNKSNYYIADNNFDNLTTIKKLFDDVLVDGYGLENNIHTKYSCSTVVKNNTNIDELVLSYNKRMPYCKIGTKITISSTTHNELNGMWVAIHCSTSSLVLNRISSANISLSDISIVDDVLSIKISPFGWLKIDDGKYQSKSGDWFFIKNLIIESGDNKLIINTSFEPTIDVKFSVYKNMPSYYSHDKYLIVGDSNYIRMVFATPHKAEVPQYNYNFIFDSYIKNVTTFNDYYIRNIFEYKDSANNTNINVVNSTYDFIHNRFMSYNKMISYANKFNFVSGYSFYSDFVSDFDINYLSIKSNTYNKTYGRSIEVYYDNGYIEFDSSFLEYGVYITERYDLFKGYIR